MEEGFDLSMTQKVANLLNDRVHELAQEHSCTGQEIMEILLHLTACNLVATATDKSAIPMFIKAMEKAMKDYWKRDFAKVQEIRKMGAISG